MDVAQLGFAADTSGLKDANRELEKLPKSAGRAEAAAGKVTKATERMANEAERDAMSIKRAFGSAGAAIGGFVAAFASVEGARRIMGAASRSAREFETAIAEVGTLLNDTSGLQAQGIALRELTKAYGGTAAAQAKAYYQAISAGAAEGAEALDLLDTANKLAVGGITSVETAVDGLTTVLNAYGDEAGTAEDVSDALFVGMRAGKTTIDQLSNSIGNVASIAAQSGASFEEVVAAAAALTKGGVQTSVAMNGLRAILAAVVKPTAEASKLAQQLGLEFDAASLKSKGFAQFIKDVAEATGGSSAQMAVLFGGVEALSPAMALAGKASADFATILADMDNRAGQTDAAFGKMAETAEFRLGVAMAKLNDELIDLGQEINARMVPAAEFLADNFDDIVRIGGILAELIALRLTVAVVNSTAAWAANAGAMGAATVAANGLRSVMALLGGPAGLIIVAGYALLQMAEGMDSSTRAAGELRNALDNLKTATDETRQVALDEAVARRANALAMLDEAEAALELHKRRMQLASGAQGVREGGADFRIASEQAAGRAAEGIAKLRKEIEEANRAIGDMDTTGADVEKLLGEIATEGPKAATGVRTLGTDTKKTSKALGEASKELEEYRDGMEMLAAELEGPLAVATLNNQRELDRLQELYFEGRLGMEEASRYLALLEKQFAETTRAIKEQNKETDTFGKGLKDAIADVEDEIAVLNTSGMQREMLIEQLRAEAIMRQVTAGATDEQLAKYAKELDALRERLKLAGELRAAGSFNFAGLIADSVERGMNQASLRGFFENFAEGLRRAFTRVEGESGSAFAQRVVRNAADIAEFAAFGVEQFRQNPDAPLRAVAAIASQIPGIVGEVARVVTAIDSIFGGRLLGTNYERESSARSFTIGSGGAGGTESITESRQRSLFRGTRRRTTTEDLSGDALRAIEELFKAVEEAMASAARALGTDVPELVAGNFRQEFDKDGNLVREFSEVLGRVYEETFEQFAQRITAENIIAAVAATVGNVPGSIGGGGGVPGLPGVPGRPGFPGPGDRTQKDLAEAAAMANEAQLIAERWRDDAELLLEGAQLMLAAQTDILKGNSLLLSDGPGSLTAVVDLIEELALPGEQLVETYGRVKVATELLTQATDLMGIEFGLAREDFVRFAADISEAAGGLERAQQLWTRYFDTFYTEQERLEASLAQAETRRADELADIGVDPGITPEAFRAMFERVLPTLSAEAVVQWLEAAEAIGIVIDLQERYNEVIGATAAMFDVEAAMDYAAAVGDIRREIAALSGQSDFQQSLGEIAQAYNENVTQLNAMARAAGLAGAREEDLAAAMELATLQRERAIAALEAEAMSLADQLGYTELGQVQAEIERQSRSATSSLDTFGDSLQTVGNRASEIADAMLGEFSPLRGREKSDFALSALRKGQISLDQALRAGRDVFKSGDDFNRFFSEAVEIAEGLGGTRRRGGGGSRAEDALRRRESELQAERDEAARFGVASTLAQQIADIAGARGEDFGTVAERLGFSLSQLGDDLGLTGDALFEYLTSLQADAYGISELASVMRADTDYLLAGLREIFAHENPIDVDQVDIGGGEGFAGPPALIPGPTLGGKSESESNADAERRHQEVLEENRLLRQQVSELLATIASNTAEAPEAVHALAESLASDGAQVRASAPRGIRSKDAPR